MFILAILFVLLISAKKSNHTLHLPVLLFKFNSIVFDTTSTDDETEYKEMDTTEIIKFIVDEIKSNPQYKIMILAHRDSKEKAKDLGLQRAKKVEKLLIENGVNKENVDENYYFIFFEVYRSSLCRLLFL